MASCHLEELEQEAWGAASAAVPYKANLGSASSKVDDSAEEHVADAEAVSAAVVEAFYVQKVVAVEC